MMLTSARWNKPLCHWCVGRDRDDWHQRSLLRRLLEEMLTLNQTRAMDDVDITKLHIRTFDGKSSGQ
jgi:hypothetical protein